MNATTARNAALALALAAAAGCSDAPSGPSPGSLSVRTATATTARAVLLRVTGAPVAAIAAPPAGAYTVYFDSTHADTVLIVVIAARGSTLGAGALAVLQVPDTRAAGRYAVTAVQASDQSNALLPAGGGFTLSVGP